MSTREELVKAVEDARCAIWGVTCPSSAWGAAWHAYSAAASALIAYDKENTQNDLSNDSQNAQRSRGT